MRRHILTHPSAITFAKRLTALIGLFSLFALMGCGDDHYVKFRRISTPPQQVVLQRDYIEIPEGIAAAVQVMAMVNDRENKDIVVDFEPQSSGILGIESDLDGENWIIYGIAPGETLIEVYFDDELVGDLRGRVLEQYANP